MEGWFFDIRNYHVSTDHVHKQFISVEQFYGIYFIYFYVLFFIIWIYNNIWVAAGVIIIKCRALYLITLFIDFVAGVRKAYFFLVCVYRNSLAIFDILFNFIHFSLSVNYEQHDPLWWDNNIEITDLFIDMNFSDVFYIMIVGSYCTNSYVVVITNCK